MGKMIVLAGNVGQGNPLLQRYYQKDWILHHIMNQ